MRHVRFSRRIKARPVFDDLPIHALRPAGDGIVKHAPSVKEIPLGVFPGSNFFVVHAFTLSPGTATRQGSTSDGTEIHKRLGDCYGHLGDLERLERMLTPDERDKLDLRELSDSELKLLRLKK